VIFRPSSKVATTVPAAAAASAWPASRVAVTVFGGGAGGGDAGDAAGGAADCAHTAAVNRKNRNDFMRLVMFILA
jgi:hypothetical protein